LREADVTDLESMEAAAAVAVDAFGGIDLLVSNAGILKAGGIEEMDVDSFDAVNAVNYKGFFIAVKAVTPFMKLQHAHNRDHFMDIAQINSKSGIEGSNRNFAYAGSKFGSIGLVQSFALELIGSNIKVNAICPGNYFDGPLWSDPEEGLFVQYLAAGKIPGATTLDEVKDFYISKVPMKRGCLPEDVVTALLYLRDQQYETGQALPVTGGQIMLK
jgi:NAD(P)-dependent dehydrogenase (short-subunit alcohol dehydrogenase family)